MSEEHPSVSSRELVERYRRGDSSAADLLHQRYSERLLQVAKQRLSPRLVVRKDGDDVVQSVFRSFFTRIQLGQYSFQDSSDLWKLLVNITIKKVCDAAREHRAEKRNMNAEARPDTDSWLIQILSRDPGPSEAIMLEEALEALLQRFPLPQHRKIIELAFEMPLPRPLLTVEIARQIGLSKRQVDRVLERVDRILKNRDGHADSMS